MSQEIEIEFKNLLTKQEFETFLTSFRISKSDFINQENHYFDTLEYALKAQRSALRIRKKQDTYTLTLKQPHLQGILETHQLLTTDQTNSLLNNGSTLQHMDGKIKENLLLMGINPSEVIYLGTLKTDRAEIKHGNNLLILDHSYYLGQEDYELEYEVKDPIQGKQAFLNILDQYKVPLRATKNKITRFFQIKEQQQS